MSPPQSQPQILSIDLGSSSIKVAAVGVDGSIAASAVRSIETLKLPGGGAEQDADEIWSSLLDAGREVIGSPAVDVSRLAGVTCTGQYFSLVPVNANGHAVGNLILWLDVRGRPQAREIYRLQPGAMQQWLGINGLFPLPTGNDSLSHALFLKHRQAEIYERADKLLEPVDFITARLTGRCTSNACSAFAQLLTDNRDLGNVRYHEDLVRMSGIDAEKLPELVEVGSAVGELVAEIAAGWGVPPGVPVFAGTNDTQAVSVGTGIFMGPRGGINIGTTCQVLAFVDDLRADLDNNLFSMPSALPDRYTLMAENGLGGRLVEHFLQKVVFADDDLADHSSELDPSAVEAALAAVPPGSNGLLYLPWLTGSQTPRSNTSMRGGFLNMSLDTSRAEMLRAVIEGVSFSLRWQLPAAEKLCGHSFEELRFAGGGAQSGQWAQAIADVMDRPVRQMADPRHVNNRATALLAFDRLGLASLRDCDTFSPVAASYLPRAANRDLYDDLFAAFQQAFEQTVPIFEALNPKRGRK